MTPIHSAPVLGKDGWRGKLDLVSPVQGAAEPSVVIQLDAGGQVIVPVSALSAQGDGTYYLPLTLTELGVETRRPSRAGEEIVVPLLAEEMTVRKEQVQTGGVRVSMQVREREEIVEAPVMREEVSVERVPVNRVVDGPLPIRYEGDTTIVPVLEEVIVVEKRLMLKEEVRITRAQVEARSQQRVTLRSEEAHVERIEPDDRLTPGGPDAEEDDVFPTSTAGAARDRSR